MARHWLHFDVIRDKLFSDLKHCDGPIVDVGSGSGVIAHRFGDKIISVDPDPTSFTDIPLVQPDVKYCDELIHLKDKCNMCILWSLPDHTYDIDAIQLLQPQELFIVAELSGIAGSDSLIEFISRICDNLYNWRPMREKISKHLDMPTYKCLSYTVCEPSAELAIIYLHAIKMVV